MRKLLAAGSMAVLMAACSAGAQPGGDAEASGSGGQTQRSFQVGAFERISLEGSHDVVVTVGGAPSVRAEGDAEVLQRLEIRVENGALKIGTERGNWSWGRRRGHATVYVTVPSLTGAAIAGSGDMRIDRVEAQRFAASIGGSGDLEIAALRARQANFSIAGSGGIRASGQAEETDISIAGSGSMSLNGLQSRRADVSVAGSGDVAIHASESVDASVLGSGDINVEGGARCSVTKMGSGEVRCG
jgi:hypothetical protein